MHLTSLQIAYAYIIWPALQMYVYLLCAMLHIYV